MANGRVRKTAQQAEQIDLSRRTLLHGALVKNVSELIRLIGPTS